LRSGRYVKDRTRRRPKVKTVELKDLIGLHTLSAVEAGYIQGKDHEGCNYLSFILDGKKYTAFEDPSDGYRSCVEAYHWEAGSLETLKERIAEMKDSLLSDDAMSLAFKTYWKYRKENKL
jgi:hypothetical protein